jgi:peroxiredoxin
LLRAAFISRFLRNGWESRIVNASIFVVLCALLLQPLCAASPLVGKTAPAFSRTDFQQKKLELRAFRGKVVLLNFWATWCGPCLQEMPRFSAWQTQYGPRGLQIIGISMDDDPALAQKIVAKLRLNYPVAMGDEKLGAAYGGVLGLPLTFLIDRDGVIQAQFSGEGDLKEMEEKLKALLGP